jgi:Xaa-Pro aminopeptidase
VFILLCRDRDPDRELWDGPRAGPDGAVAVYGADDAFPIADVDDILPGLLERSDRVYYSIGATDFDQRLLAFIQTLNSKRQSGHAPSELVALDHVLHEMRLFKSRAESGVLRQSAKIAVAAHARAMRAARPGMMEYELEAEFLHEFRRHGAEPSYPPIVATGANACVLHYSSNDAQLADGDLVLIDAGCELEMYASDVTRTWPANGTFSKPQRELYDVVLGANRAATQKARAGNHWNDPHDAAVLEITKGLKELGLLRGRVPNLVKSQAYRQFFMHKTGHWLGIDVHDVGDYKVHDHWRMLEPGMVMTIEPGIYVSPAAKQVDKRWRGIGIRIEDDVQVTRDGPEVLTANLPSTVEEIETHMAARA